jgi:nitroreductase
VAFVMNRGGPAGATGPVAGFPPDGVLEDLLTSRYSCRAFRPDPVPRETIVRLLELAQRTPSWCNTQPWRVHVTAGASSTRLRRLLEATVCHEPAPDLPFPSAYTGVRQERRRAVAWQLYEAVGVAYGDRDASARQTAENFSLFGAPHVAVIAAPAELGVYGAVDCGLYVSTFLLAAQSLGLGSVAQAALASRSAVLREFLGIPDDHHVVCGISFGWPADHPVNSFRSVRSALAESVTWHD